MIVYSCQHKPLDYATLTTKPFPAKLVYKWHIANFTNDMDKYKVILTFERVIQIWQRAIDQIEPRQVCITFESTNDITQADFIFTFGVSYHKFLDKFKDEHECPFPFDDAGGVLAHAWSLCQDDVYGGHIHLDEAENWSEMHSNNHTHLLTVILHEMGHCLDIDHSSVKQSIMYPSYTGVKTSLDIDDILALTEKFKPVKLSFMPKKKKPWWRFW